MLDGAGYNAPVYDDGKGGEYREIPPMPDRKTQPVQYLRWQWLDSPGVPGIARPSTEDVDRMCDRFQSEIECGEKVWSDDYFDWVRPELLNQPTG